MFNKLNFGMRGHDTKADDIESLAKILEEAGASHVQLALKKSFKDINWQNSILTPELGCYIKNTLAKHGVRVSVLGCYINPVHPDEAKRKEEVEWFKAHLKFAKYLGCDMVGTETGFYNTFGETHTEENYQRFFKSMREIVDCAENLGSIVGVETVTKHSMFNPKMTKRFLDEIDSPNVTIIYDPVNISDMNDRDEQHKIVDEVYSLYGDRIGILHFKDYEVIDGKKEGRLAGDGVFDYEYLFKYAKKYTPVINAILETNNEDNFKNTAEKILSIWDSTVAE